MENDVSLKNRFRFRLFGNIIEIPNVAFVYVLILPSLTYFFSIMNLGIFSSVLQAVNIILFAFMLFNIMFDLKKLLRYLVLFGVVVLLIVVEWNCYPANRPALEEMIQPMLLQVYYFTIANEIYDSEKVVDMLTRASYIVLAAAAVGTIIFASSRDNRIMVSNAFFLCMMVFLFRNKKKPVHVICGVFALIMMLLFGRRQHILYFLVVLCIIYIRKLYKEGTRKKIAGVAVVACFVAVIAAFYSTLMTALGSLLASTGISSRTLSMFADGSITDLNGREALFDIAIDLMNEHPFIGNGIGATMVEAKKVFYTSLRDAAYSGSNTHNGILEMGAEFGMIAMIAFIVVHAVIVVKIVRLQLSAEEEIILYVLLGTGFTAVLIGASYLNVMQYAMFWGYFLLLCKRHRNTNEVV